MFKVNNRNSRTRCEICSKLTIKTPEQPQWRLKNLWTYFTPCPSVSIVNFEQANAGWKRKERASKMFEKDVIFVVCDIVIGDFPKFWQTFLDFGACKAVKAR